jgi:hypothetical protein
MARRDERGKGQDSVLQYERRGVHYMEEEGRKNHYRWQYGRHTHTGKVEERMR